MNKRLLYVSCCIIACITILSQCINKAEKNEAAFRGPQYAGAAACAGCHKNIFDTYMGTAHYHTSMPANTSTVKGSFAAPDHTFTYDSATKVVMEARDSGLFQAAYNNDVPQESHRFDIVVGSGRKAQTYLYWQAGKYFQLPLSYFVPAHSWANSPGFPADHPKFDRMIPSTCFGCHSSMVAKSTDMQGVHIVESFEKNQVVYGIDCERCHGPAAEHVQFQSSHPQEKKAMYMTRIAELKNQQKLDMCALCHSGLGTPQKSMFDFKPGDALSGYFFPEFTAPKRTAQMDVHGTQYQLFTASKCFMKSNDMNCSSCHNPHNSESNNMELFSQRCMHCHNTASHNFCKLAELPANILAKNCIDCHMPALPSANITLLTNGKQSPTPDSIRTHLITIYKEETKKVLARLKQAS
ncbi:Cytochrome c554 and c-prime [Chitinophaga rupis]|uniref:Cytochrome c554 and c-prime n=1 Tax=Chitinophaga rupis TaxID=573321 RepID=A0A1H8B852_9BACT|nr:multiheme c-type cytochrome [Chitinophaga rupis]SEM78284.1 Cytochrome c554 and c-prime [Chitinophaga rupis]